MDGNKPENLEQAASDPLNKLIEFFSTRSTDKKQSINISFGWALLILIALLAVHIITNGFKTGVPPAFYTLPAPFYSIKFRPIMDYIWPVAIGMLIVKMIYHTCISGLLWLGHAKDKKPSFQRLKSICSLAIIANLALAIPFTGIWLAWILESLLIIYFFRRLCNINMLFSLAAIIISLLLASLIACLITIIPLEFDSDTLKGVLFALPAYPYLLLFIN